MVALLAGCDDQQRHVLQENPSELLHDRHSEFSNDSR